ncbi:cysteine-rich receptor-like protein kinase, partial [Trifolium medium]|nr:cysteine-rich receptor-like protein kinase [Trifolium medium]
MSGCTMKILSWNVRGLGRLEKKKEAKKLINEKHPFIVCIQETKLGFCDDFLCVLLWGNLPHGYSFRPSAGASGGLLVLWDAAEVEVRSTVSLPQAQLRGLSGHCPLSLSVDEENWGPRPLQMLKCWQDIPGYKQFVISKWQSMHLDGWGGFVLKEKLKLLKTALKEWHITHTKNVPGRIDSLKVRLAALDCKGEAEGLSEDETAELYAVTSDIHSLTRMNTSIYWQQARLMWLREGDVNLKYFQSILTSRRRRNAWSSIMVDGLRVEGVQPVRQAVFSHFSSHFKAVRVDRPRVDDFQFSTLSPSEGGSLVKPFSVDEVKAAVWDCDSYKSLGPDGINFGFLKEFWPELQGDIMSLYKILSKVLVNRLRQVVGSVVSEVQSAFVKERQILDGTLVANEVVDDACKQQKELVLFKVDFEKAYDSVDWGYLDDVMRRMAFPVLWR